MSECEASFSLHEIHYTKKYRVAQKFVYLIRVPIQYWTNEHRYFFEKIREIQIIQESFQVVNLDYSYFFKIFFSFGFLRHRINFLILKIWPAQVSNRMRNYAINAPEMRVKISADVYVLMDLTKSSKRNN